MSSIDKYVGRGVDGAFLDGRPFKIAIHSPEPIGTGGTAHVYRARAYVDGRYWDVAVKVFVNPMDKTRKTLLAKELAAALRVRHAHILPFVGMLEIEQLPAIVSQYMGKGDMLQYLKEHPGADCRRLVMQVAEAVLYLHQDAGFVHGDLKCSNVLISDGGDAMVSDFGLSTFAEKAPSTETTMTSVREMYSLRFAAPELLLGPDEGTSPRSKTRESDIYALGMLILEAFTRKAPWEGLREHQVMYSVTSGHIPARPPGTGVLSGLSDAWWNVCVNCWKFDPRQRPAIQPVLQEIRANRRTPCVMLREPTTGVLSAVFMRCGTTVVAGLGDGTLSFRPVIAGSDQAELLRGHTEKVNCVAVSPDGSQVSSCSHDCTILRWDVASKKVDGEPLIGHREGILSLAYSPDGSKIVSGGRDETVRVWSAQSKECVGNVLCGQLGTVRSVAFSPDGTLIAAGGRRNDAIHIWNAATGDHIRSLFGHTDTVSCVAFSPDGRHIVSGSCDHSVRIWEVAALAPPRVLDGHLDWVRAVAVSPCGTYIASASDDHYSVCMWRMDSGEPACAPLGGHSEESYVYAVAFSRDGCKLVSSSSDGTVCVWPLFD